MDTDDEDSRPMYFDTRSFLDYDAAMSDRVDIIDIPITAHKEDLQPFFELCGGGGAITWKDLSLAHGTKTARIHFADARAAAKALSMATSPIKRSDQPSIDSESMTQQPAIRIRGVAVHILPVQYGASSYSEYVREVSLARSFPGNNSVGINVSNTSDFIGGDSSGSIRPTTITMASVSPKASTFGERTGPQPIEMAYQFQHQQYLQQKEMLKAANRRRFKHIRKLFYKENSGVITGLISLAAFLFLLSLQIDSKLRYNNSQWDFALIFTPLWIAYLSVVVVVYSCFFFPTKPRRRHKASRALLSLIDAVESGLQGFSQTKKTVIIFSLTTIISLLVGTFIALLNIRAMGIIRWRYIFIFLPLISMFAPVLLLAFAALLWRLRRLFTRSSQSTSKTPLLAAPAQPSAAPIAVRKNSIVSGVVTQSKRYLFLNGQLIVTGFSVALFLVLLQLKLDAIILDIAYPWMVVFGVLFVACLFSIASGITFIVQRMTTDKKRPTVEFVSAFFLLIMPGCCILVFSALLALHLDKHLPPMPFVYMFIPLELMCLLTALLLIINVVLRGYLL